VITLLVNDDPARSNRDEALAAMRIADVMLINSVFDGMNLVAKEACIAGDADSVLVLSGNVGAAEEFGSAALLVDPFDVSDTTGALDRALAMPAGERQQRAAEVRAAVDTRPVIRWLERQLEVSQANHAVTPDWPEVAAARTKRMTQPESAGSRFSGTRSDTARLGRSRPDVRLAPSLA
jgi:trehalose-6-phosphate synthase